MVGPKRVGVSASTGQEETSLGVPSSQGRPWYVLSWSISVEDLVHVWITAEPMSGLSAGATQKRGEERDRGGKLSTQL